MKLAWGRNSGFVQTVQGVEIELSIRLYPKRAGRFIKHNQDFFIVTLAVLLKEIFFSASIGFGFGSLEGVVSSAAILLGLFCVSLVFPFRTRTWLLLLLDLVISVMLLADLLFYRFFHSVITIPVLFEAGQVEGVSSSVAALLSNWDALFFADFVFLIPYFIYLNKHNLGFRYRWLRRVGQVAVILLVCGLTLNFTTQNVEANFSQNAYTGLSWDTSVLRNLGVVNFHLLDLYSFLKQKDAKGSLESEAPQLKAWMGSHSEPSNLNLTGAAKGKNLIIIQLEATQEFLLGRSVNGQEVTPNLNRLTQSSIYFDNFFTQIGQGNTSDAEFMTLNSLYPAPSGSNYVMHANDTYQSLPWTLKGAGYQGAYAFHANTPQFWNRANMYKVEGFDKFFNDSNFFRDDENVGMGLSDASMFRQALTQIKQLPQPYFSFLITLSGHYPYDIPDSKKTLNIPAGEYSGMFKNYLQAQHYADQALGDFMNQLQQQGILSNSVVVVYGDHYGTGWTNQDLEKFLGTNQPLSDYQLKELNKVPLLIHLPWGQAAGTRHISGGEMDLFPTLLNLLGVDSGKEFYFGQDLLNAKDGFSAFRVWTPDGSFATDEVFYIANWDGKFEDGTAYNRKTGQKISLQGLKDDYDLAEWELHASDLILQTNSLPQLIPINH